MKMAAGKMTGPRLITFTAVTLAVMRQVMKIAVIITNRCETFILKPSTCPDYIKRLRRKKRSMPPMITAMIRKTNKRE